MAIDKKLDIRAESIESIYSYYYKKSLLVNRKYQRKLVWTIEEKEKFIDSILKSLPIPLILVALTKHKEKMVYEIIDGIQRLNAIVSFIENEVHLNGNYFNLDALALTKTQRDTGKLKQKLPKLDLNQCLDITSYQLPFSISKYDAEEDIEEIFRRINSYGKRLSSHELRQAGSSGTFPEIVRKLSENIRTDVSPSNKILLGDMRKISLNNRGIKQGIDLRDVFWFNQYILTENNIRASRDEELIAHLLIAMILDYEMNISSTALDRAYGLSDDDYENIDTDTYIKKYGGKAFLIAQFEAIFFEIRKTLEHGSKDFRSLLFHKKSKYINNAFQVVFLTFHQLLVKEGMKIDNYQALNTELEGIGDRFISPVIDDIRHRAERKRCIEAIAGVIKKHFSKRDQNDPALSNGVIKLETLLKASKTENTPYDFKQGVYQMDKNNKNIRNKIIRTLTSFVNQGKNSIGYIVLGIADSQHMANQHEKYYGVKPISINNFFVTGVDEECKMHCKSIDEYRTKLEQAIKSADIQPEYYKTQILKNIDGFTYMDKSVIILRVQADKDPVKFEGKFYHRQGTSTEVVRDSEERHIWELFLK